MTYIVCLSGVLDMNISFVLLSSLILRCFSQTVTNVLNAKKNTDNDLLIFNVKVNGAYYFLNDQVVTESSNYEQFPFDREFSDVVEVVIVQSSSFPGNYHINSNEYSSFTSMTIKFYPVNQCPTTCGFKIVPIGSSFPDGLTANIYINGVLSISNYNGSAQSQTVSVETGDFIYVTLSDSVSGNFGMNFVTTTAGQESTVSWYNQNLATQMLIPSVYFAAPLNSVTIYPDTDLPITLVSYPVSAVFPVVLLCNDLFIESYPIISNTETTQNFSIPRNLNPSIYQNCSFSTESPNHDFFGLNYVDVEVKAPIPFAIELVSGLISPSYFAGTSIPIQLNSADGDGNFMVQLACGTLDPVIRVIPSNTVDPQNFLIPDTFYGNQCTIIIPYPLPLSGPLITVTQPISFLHPLINEVFVINQPIPVTPIAQAIIPDNPITVIQVCGTSTINHPNVAVNSTFSANAPLNYVGQCTFTSLQSDLYNPASPTVTITIINQLIFFKAPSSLLSVQKFLVRIDTVGVPVVGSETVTLVLNCIEQVQSWTEVALNTAAILNLDAPNLTGGPLRCTLSTLPSQFYTSISSQLTVLTQMTTTEINQYIQANGFTSGTKWIN